jgi:thiamine pyrophosphokinase
MLAVREGLRRDLPNFVLLFSLGGRLDHAIANSRRLRFCRNTARTAN